MTLTEDKIRLLADGVLSICNALDARLDDVLDDMDATGILTSEQRREVEDYIANF